MGGGALRGEVLAQRDEGRRRRGIEGRRVVGPFDLVHVEVAGRPGDSPEPGEVVTGLPANIVGEHLGGVAEHDTSPPHGDAQVVEELGIDVGDRPVPIGEHRVAEVAEHGPKPVDGRVVPGERDADRHSVAIQRDACAGCGELRQTALRGHETEPVEQIAQLGSGFGVAGQLGRFDDDAVEGDPGDRRGIVDGYDRRDLAVAVAFRSRSALRRHLDEAEQGPHVEQPGEAMAQRPSRNIVGEARLARHGDRGGDAVGAAEGEVMSIDELEAQPGLGDPPVERVEHGDRR